MSVIRAGLCLLIAFAVLAFGAVQAWSSSIVEIGAAVLLVIWTLLVFRDPSAKIQWNPLNGPFAAFLAVALLQLLFHGTAYPFLTRVEVLRVAAYFIIFFLAAQAFQKRSDLSIVVWFLILFCFAVSLLGIIQHFTSEKEIYWLSSLNIQGDSFGPFVNRNHFAGFVELTLPVGLALIVFRGIHKEQFFLLTLLTIVPVSALVLSGSRGGIVGFGFELCVLFLLVRTKRSRSPEDSRILALGMVAVAALALVMWIGARRAIERFSVLPTQDLSLSRRVSMARGALGIFGDHPLKGSGLGTLVAVYPRYETIYDGLVVEHVHNDYLEGLAETGFAGALCGLVFLWLLFREARRSFQGEQGHFGSSVRAGSITAVSGLLLHSLIDFNLHIPSNALLFLLQCFLATSGPLPADSAHVQHRQRSREYTAVDG